MFHKMLLFCILLGGLAAFYYVRSDRTLQFAVGTVTSIAYVFWGIVHHILEKDIHGNLVVEYVLMAGVAIVILATILF